MSDTTTPTAKPTTTQDKLIEALTLLGTAGATHALSGNAQSAGAAAVPPELRQLLQLSVDRQNFQNPLFQATTQGVYSMLPTFAKQGTSLGSFSPSPVSPMPDGGGGGAATGLGLAAAFGPELIKLIRDWIAKKGITDAGIAGTGGLPKPKPSGGGAAGGMGGGGDSFGIGTPNYGALAGSQASPLFPQLGAGGGFGGTDQIGDYGLHAKAV